ncbi:substrate-binding domain-containing protein [Ruminococcus sp.]|uniref:substrate-binding domain-containing protein n=1 Tax=Ruminococcus sp. TaxID=41978 RepID=UPI0038630200
MAIITQSEIAKLAGVSRATVGRVVNNAGDVNEETREKILAIMKEHDYRPNKAGQALVNRQKEIRIGCIIIKSDNPFFNQLNEGILEKADELKYYGIEVIMRSVEFEASAQLSCVSELLSLGISALVIQPFMDKSICEKLLSIEKSGIPVVTVNTDMPDYQSSFCYVGNDFYMCGKTAANLMRLITAGRCEAGVIVGFSKAKSHTDRVLGFRDYLKDCPDMHIVDIQDNNDDDMESYYIAKTMLLAHPRLNAIFLVAGGVYGACRAIRDVCSGTGRHITVISFDDVPATREMVRNGTIAATICQQPQRQGRLALSVLYDYLIEGKAPSSNRLYTDIQIKVAANIDV